MKGYNRFMKIVLASKLGRQILIERGKPYQETSELIMASIFRGRFFVS